MENKKAKETIDGLKCCISKLCYQCPYRNDPVCRASLMNDAVTKLQKFVHKED